MLLGGGMKVIIRRGLDIPGLRLLNRLRRMLPDFPFHKPGAMPQGRLAHKLGAVGPFDAHILMLVFVNLPMHKAVGGAAGHPAHTPHRARLFGRLLFCQLFLCPIQLFPALFHAEFGCRRLSPGCFSAGILTLGHFVPKCPGAFFASPPDRRPQPPPWVRGPRRYSVFVSFFTSSGRVVSRL